MADRRKPSASGHRTSQNMSKAEANALTMAWMITIFSLAAEGQD